MARMSRSKPKNQPAKKQGASARGSPRKTSAKAAPARQARKGKPAHRGAAKPKRTTPKAKAAAKKPQTEQARAAVARKRPAPAGTTKLEAQAEHDHQDPRLAGIPGINHEGDKVQAENYGAFKTKAVARMDKPTNWFRRAAKPKS